MPTDDNQVINQTVHYQSDPVGFVNLVSRQQQQAAKQQEKGSWLPTDTQPC